LQAILFYAPRWLWKTWEDGKIQALKMDLHVGVMTEVDREQKKAMMLDYLDRNMGCHNYWACKYFFCEFLALVNVIGVCNVCHSLSNKGPETGTSKSNIFAALN
jgi:hypothetical protein